MPKRKTINVSLTPVLEPYVAKRLASGRYRSASEVVRATLRLLEKDEPGEYSQNGGLLRQREGAGSHAD
jgi:antitoxin ParD1/3/4